MKIALTGGSGFVGAALIDHFAANGAHVRALVHRRAIVKAGVESVPGGLSDAAALERLCEGADLVVHAAGLTQGDGRALFVVNEAGTRRLAEAAERSGAARFLLISSLAASRPEVSAYAASKAAAEKALAGVVAPERFAILRPPAVYGPGDEATAPFFRLARAGLAPILDGGVSGALRFSLIFVDDLAAATLSLARFPEWRGERLALRDACEAGYEWSDIWGAYERVFDRRLRRFRISRKAALVLAALDMARARLTGGPSALTFGKVRELFTDGWVVRDDMLGGRTGWRPTVGLDEGLRRTAAWLAGGRDKRKGR